MWPSWRLAYNELAAKPGRTGLMIAAVTLAASVVAAVTSAIGSFQVSLEDGIVKVVGAADARVVHQFNGWIDGTWLETIRGWDEVDLAAGHLYANITLSLSEPPKHDGSEPVGSVPVTALGADLQLESQFRTIEMVDGRMPLDPGEIIIDPLTAEQLHASIGELLRAEGPGEAQELRIVGIYDRQKLGFLQRPLIRMDLSALARLANRVNLVSSIAIKLRPNRDIEAFCRRHGTELPAVLSLEPAEMLRSGFDRRVRASRLGMILGTVLTFLCASFIIVTAMTTGVTERQRQMAVLRCIGAERRQLFEAQLLVGGAVGLGGAVLGPPLGLALSAVMVWFFRELLPAGFHPVRLGIILASGGAMIAGLLGGVYPAFLASRVSPLQAMTQRGHPPRPSGPLVFGALGLLCIGAQLALLLLPDSNARFWSYVWAGMPALHLGYFLLSVPIVLLVARALGPLLSIALGIPRQMLQRSVASTPYRMGLTAGALMVGMSILVGNWSVTQSLREDWISNIRFADGFAVHRSGMDRQAQQRIAALPFVKGICPIGQVPVQIKDRQVFGVKELTPPYVICVGFDPEQFLKMNSVEWIQGDPETALPRLRQGDAILVADRFLTARGLGVGDTLTLGGKDVNHEYEIVGVISSAGLDIATQLFGVRNVYSEYTISCVFMDFDTVIAHYDNSDAYIIQLKLSDDISDEAAIEKVQAAAPGSLFFSGRWIREKIDQLADAGLAVQSSIAFSALVLASIAMGNVILANIRGRRFEYGVMRAVGASRGTVARAIIGEAMLLAAAAAVTGTALGMHLAWVGTLQYRDLLGLKVSASFPLGPTALGLLVLFGLTLLAALPGVLSMIRPRPALLVVGGRSV